MLQWLRRRRQAERLAQADAEALIRDHGAEAYGEARQREHDVILRHWAPASGLSRIISGRAFALNPCSSHKAKGLDVRPDDLMDLRKERR